MRLTAALLRSVFAIALAAAPAAAQDDPPGIFISPSGGTFGTATQDVVVTWSHGIELVQSSHWIKLNGVQLSGFTFQHKTLSPSGAVVHARSEGQVQLVAGANTLEARICSPDACSTQTATLTYVPPPPPAQRAPAQISRAPHHGGYQDPTRFGSTLSYTTPAYVSLGQPRSLTLLYTSESANPQQFVQIDVTDPSLDPADVVALSVADSTGTVMRTLSNGSTAAHWRNTGGTTGGVLRLGGQWAMTAAGGSAVKSTLIVRSYWEDAGGTHMEEATDTVRVPMINRSSSPYGAGWTVAGLQRLYPTGNGVVVDEGTGAASWFPRTAASNYVSPAGDVSTLSYAGASSTYRRTWPDGSGIVFDALGYPQYRYTLLGDTTRYAFTADRLTSVTDPAGKAFQLFYDSNDKLQRIVDPQGRTAWITVVAGQVTQIVDYDSVAAISGITYQTSGGTSTGRLSGWTDRAGGVWEVAYDAFGAVTTVTAPQVTLASGSNARPRTTSSAEKGRVMTGTGAWPTSTQAPRVLADSVYSAFTDALGHVTRVWTDRFGQPLKVVGPLGDTTVIQRDTAGHPTSVTGPDGNAVHMQWTTQGQVARSFDEARGVQTDYTYASTGGGTFLSRTSEGAEDVHYDRGSKGEVLAVRRGSDPDPVIRYRYDARMRVDTVIDAGNHVTAFFYDGNASMNLDSVRNVTTAGNQRVAYTYDAHGRTASVRHPHNVVDTVVYDALNRVRKQRMPGDSVRYGYFGADSTVVTDAVGKRYVTRFNALGWALWERDPQGRFTYAAHDSAGNVVRTTDRHGRVFTRTLDAAGRGTRLTTSDGDTLHYGYDLQGRWMWVRNAESLDTVYLDPAGRVTGRASHMGGQRFGVSTVYDGLGRKTAVTVDGGSGGGAWSGGTEYEYDTRGRLWQMRDLAGGWTQVHYNAEDLPDSIAYPGGVTRMWMGYTPRHALQQTQYTASALNTAFGASEVAYNIMDQVASRTNAGETRRREYEYAGGRLSHFSDLKQVQLRLPDECEGSSTTEGCDPVYWWSPMHEQGFGYDAVGNRTAVTYDDSASAPTNWSATVQAGSNRYAAYGGWTLEHDSVGNLTRRHKVGQDIRYGWNSLGQLIWVAPTAGDTIRYYYNGLGERVRRRQNGVDTRYIYDGDDLAAEVDASGARIRTYAYWPGIDQPHSMRTWESGQNGATYYYALDLPSNNVQGLFGTSGSVAARYDYSPFGEAYSSSGTVGNPLRFASRELDASTGLYYVRARWYDPYLGRFISEDPIGLAGGINNYAYALNDPVTLSDPTGLCYRHSNGREITVSIPGWDGGEAEPCRPWFASMIDAVIDLLGQGSVFSSEFDGPELFMKDSADGLRTAGGGSRFIVLYFLSNENDRGDLRNCPDNIRHRETEGMFEGTWVMEAVQPGHALRLVGPLKRPDVQPYEWYRGRVVTSEYGTRSAFGHVWCETGDAEFKTGPFRWP